MTPDEAKYFNKDIRKTLEELGIQEAVTAYDTKRNEIILKECVTTLRRCANLLEQGESLLNEEFVYSPAGDGYGSEDELLCLTPSLKAYGVELTPQDFSKSNPYCTKENK